MTLTDDPHGLPPIPAPPGEAPPLIIGIAGGTGSGKSALAWAVADALGDDRVARVEMDAYYRDLSHRSPEERDRAVNWDHPETFDLDRFVDDLRRLAAGEAVGAPTYDFAAHARTDAVRWIAPQPVILVDGILVLHDPRVRALCGIKVFVDTDADIRLLRRIRRDTAERGRTLDSVLNQYLATVQPMHLQFVEPSKRYADLIVPRGGANAIAIDMLVARIRHRLHDAAGVLELATPEGAT